MAYLTGKEPKEKDFEPCTWAMYQMARETSAANYLLSWTLLQQLARTIAQFQQTYDVMLTPTLGEPPLRLGTLDAKPDFPLAPLYRAAKFVPFTPLCNFTGQPAMSVPLHWSADGLPIGAHFVGRFGEEGTLFRLAAQLEIAQPWADKRPPVFAA
jgi:amidase